MSKQNLLIDAVKTAKSIHEGDYSSLLGKSFVIRGNMKNNKGRGKHVNNPTNKKYTINQIGEMVVGIKDGLEQVNTRIDKLEKGINDRLDYIVKTNNLKDLPH